LATLPDALLLAKDHLERARRTQKAAEQRHWLDVQRRVTDKAERWLCGMLSGHHSLWPYDDIRQPVGPDRVRMVDALKARYPLPIVEEPSV